MKFKEFCEFQEGYVNPTQKKTEYFEGPYKWLRATDLNDGQVYKTSRTLSKEGFESAGKSSKLFKPNSIAISKSGTIGRLGILRDYMCGNRAVINIEVDEKVMDSMYVFYWLLLNRPLIQELAVGSVQKNLYISALEDLEIDYLPLEEQKGISNLLTSLDMKIDNNTKLTKKLEEQKRLLFKNWFIDFEFPALEYQPYKSSGGKMIESEIGLIPETFKIINIKQLLQQKTNKVKLEEIDEEISYIGLEHMPRESIALNNWETSEKVKGTKGVFENGDILFGKLRPYFKKVGVAPISGVCSTDILVLNSKQEIHYYFLISILSSNDFIDYATSGSTGTRMPRADINHMGQYKICIPTNDTLLEKFNGIVAPIVEHMAMLTLQNKKLTTLRDTLLPKLLSGEIEVPVLEPEQV